LRRSFSVLPEARRLVTSGPYSLIRHPVYLSEEITLFGVMLQFVQPWAFLVFAIQLCFQFARIPFEERVLADAYPEYAEYSSRTARLLPGIY
jgi:protein-S-isoprenylcysteine O-methyltransferase Ste14